MTWAKIKSQTLKRLSHPDAPRILRFLNSTVVCNFPAFIFYKTEMIIINNNNNNVFLTEWIWTFNELFLKIKPAMVPWAENQKGCWAHLLAKWLSLSSLAARLKSSQGRQITACCGPSVLFAKIVTASGILSGRHAKWYTRSCFSFNYLKNSIGKYYHR